MTSINLGNVKNRTQGRWEQSENTIHCAVRPAPHQLKLLFRLIVSFPATNWPSQWFRATTAIQLWSSVRAEVVALWLRGSTLAYGDCGLGLNSQRKLKFFLRVHTSVLKRAPWTLVFFFSYCLCVFLNRWLVSHLTSSCLLLLMQSKQMVSVHCHYHCRDPAFRTTLVLLVSSGGRKKNLWSFDTLKGNFWSTLAKLRWKLRRKYFFLTWALHKLLLSRKRSSGQKKFWNCLSLNLILAYFRHQILFCVLMFWSIRRNDTKADILQCWLSTTAPLLLRQRNEQILMMSTNLAAPWCTDSRDSNLGFR